MSYTPPEGWAEYVRKRRAKETPEQREIRNEYQRRYREKNRDEIKAKARERYAEKRKGQPRLKPGADTGYTENTKNHNVSLPPSLTEKLRRLGDGNLSRGVRIAAEIALEASE